MCHHTTERAEAAGTGPGPHQDRKGAHTRAQAHARFYLLVEWDGTLNSQWEGLWAELGLMGRDAGSGGPLSQSRDPSERASALPQEERAPFVTRP